MWNVIKKIEYTETDYDKDYADTEAQQEEALDALDVACDIEVKAKDTLSDVEEALQNPEVAEATRIVKLSNNALIDMTVRLDLPEHYYTASTETIVEPYSSLELVRESLKEVGKSVKRTIKTVWNKIVAFFKKLWRISMKIFYDRIRKLGNMIKEFPINDSNEYGIVGEVDSLSKRLNDPAKYAWPRNDNDSKLLSGNKLAEKVFTYIPDMKAMTSQVNKIVSSTVVWSSSYIKSAQDKSIPFDTSKLQSLISDCNAFNNIAKGLTSSSTPETGVVASGTNIYYIDMASSNSKKEDNSRFQDQAERYRTALIKSKSRLVEFRDGLQVRISSLESAQEALNNAIDKAIAKLDTEFMNSVDLLDSIKSDGKNVASTNANANNSASENKYSLAAYKSMMVMVTDVLQSGYKQIDGGLDTAIEVCKNIKDQLSKKSSNESLDDDLLISLEELDLSTEGLGEILAKIYTTIKEFLIKAWRWLMGEPSEKANKSVEKAKSTMEKLKESPTTAIKAKCKWKDHYRILMYIENKSDPKSGLDLVAASTKYEALIKPYAERIDKLCKLQNNLIDGNDIKSELNSIKDKDEFIDKWIDFKDKFNNTNINKDSEFEFNVSFKSLEALRDTQNKILKEFKNAVASGPSSLVSSMDIATSIGDKDYFEKFDKFMKQKGSLNMSKDQVEDFKTLGKLIAEVTKSLREIASDMFNVLGAGSEFYIDNVALHVEERTGKHTGVIANGDKAEFAPDYL